MANKFPRGSIFDILKNGQAKKQCSRKKNYVDFPSTFGHNKKIETYWAKN